MKLNPAQQSSGARFSVSEISVYVSTFVRRAPVPVFLALVLLVGTSTSFAAQGALPGSILYPMKIGLNEKIESALALTPAAKAEVETSHALTRLSEVEELKQKGILTPEASATIKQNLSENVGALNATLAHIHAQGNAKNEAAITSKVETDLTAHLDALVQLSDEDSGLLATSSRPLVGGIVRTLVERRAEKEKERRGDTKQKKNADVQIENGVQVDTHTDDPSTFSVSGTSATTTEGVRMEIHEDATTTVRVEGTEDQRDGILKQVESFFKKRHSGKDD